MMGCNECTAWGNPSQECGYPTYDIRPYNTFTSKKGGPPKQYYIIPLPDNFKINDNGDDYGVYMYCPKCGDRSESLINEETEYIINKMKMTPKYGLRSKRLRLSQSGEYLELLKSGLDIDSPKIVVSGYGGITRIRGDAIKSIIRLAIAQEEENIERLSEEVAVLESAAGIHV